MKFPIAVQLYSVRWQMQEDFAGTVKKVKEMGYDGVEFAGLFGKSAAEVKALCEEIGIVPISAHVSYAEMTGNPDTLKTYAEIGCKYIVVPHMSADKLPGGPEYDTFAANLKKLGAEANSLGMKLCYHNHDFEFEKVDGEYKLDIIYNDIDSSLLETEIDTCWVNVGGENPADYIRKYKDRTNIIHLKDFAGKKSDNMYALIGVDDDKEKEAPAEFEFRPVGDGYQNFPEILKAAEEVDAKWVVVEIDNPSKGLTPFECIEKSINYLKSL